ncbi:MAG: Ppx/GppA family phosphatase, partial [Solirubrobacterales bacterium]
MRVAVVDIGTNSTRLLIADVDGTTVTEVERRTTVTRLGEGVDHTGELRPEAMERVYATLAEYRERIDAAGVDATTGVLTSAVRDARNGAAFTAHVNDTYNIGARTITGDEEARLTYLGATSDRPQSQEPTAVIDVGGGSTELVVG